MFEEFEVPLRDLIRRAESPVLGLLGGLMSTEARLAIRADLEVTPSPRAFAQRLDKYPALFGVWLAEHVMNGLGQDGHFSLYPHVQAALGVRGELTLSERELLWRSFRRAMFRLGIQPLARSSGTHYMVDEYIRQAGVPIAFADDLAAKMLQLARRIGLPDEDDQEGLVAWQSTLLSKLGVPFSVTARKAVERDIQAYYTRAFLRVYANGGNATTVDALEQALGKAFLKEGGTSFIKRAAIPQLLYRDGALGILFPSSSRPSAYSLTYGATKTVRVDEVGGFFPLDRALHPEVALHREDGERILSAKLWPDHASNRLLVLNADGRLRASAQLCQEGELELAPGQYVALCRFEPTNIETWEEVNEAPRLIEVRFDVHAGAETLLENGPASLRIMGHNLPTISLRGPIKASLERIEFRYASLTARVEVPPEWRQGAHQSFEVRLTSGQYKADVPVRLTEGGTAEIELIEAISQLSVPDGLRRLVVELAREGDARTLQRQSILFWKGLKSITYGLKFLFDRKPLNLMASACVGLKIGELQAEPAQEQGRQVRMAFDFGSGRSVHLSWNRPGIFVEVEVPAADGSRSVVSRPLGSTEAVSTTSAKRIIVGASEPGFVTLAGMRTYVDFAERPTKAFPASLLASRIEPGARTLSYETASGGASVPLLVLSQPHVATKVVASRVLNLLELKLSVVGAPTDLVITARELSGGRELTSELELSAGIWRVNDVGRMQAYSVGGQADHVIHLHLDLGSLKPGVWVFTFGARTGGVWGRLEDASEGRVALALALDSSCKELTPSEVVGETDSLDDKDAVERLRRLNEHFQQLWSPACWELQGWLVPYQNALLDKVRDKEAEHLTALADMAMARPSDDVRQGFFPHLSVPASLNRIFSQSRLAYKQVNIKPHPLSVSLQAMSALRGNLVDAFGSVIHPTVAFSFKNVAEMSKGLRPSGFQLERYRGVLLQTQLEGAFQLDDESFLPDRGELLGPIHLAHAWRDLERGYAKSLMMPSNRKSAAVAVARLLHQKCSTFDQTAPPGLRGAKPVLLVRRPNLELADDADAQTHENLERIANACAWLAWFCRLESRQEKALSGFHSTLGSLRKQVAIQGPSVVDCSAFFLHVAPAMFAYYLLLWELVQAVELDEGIQRV
jgi:hypothetical protein